MRMMTLVMMLIAIAHHYIAFDTDYSIMTCVGWVCGVWSDHVGLLLDWCEMIHSDAGSTFGHYAIQKLTLGHDVRVDTSIIKDFTSLFIAVEPLGGEISEANRDIKKNVRVCLFYLESTSRINR